MYKLTLFCVLLLSFSAANGQDIALQREKYNCPTNAKLNHGTLYFSFGYNRDWFSRSDIRFKDDGQGKYDFVAYNLEAADRPGFDQILTSNISIPQYSFRIGYFFNNKHDLGIEINYDHAKYVVKDQQRFRIKGIVNGSYMDADTTIGKPFLAFEHTNGANFASLFLVKRFSLLHDKSTNHWLSLLAKAGGGFVYPRTDATLFGVRRDEKFHVAGYLAGVDLGLRYDFFHHFFIENEIKYSFVHYTNALLPFGGTANHHFYAFEYILTVGASVNL